MIAVLDHGMGNRRSVEKALAHVGQPATITREVAALRAADGIVVPGVGAFPAAMRALEELGLTGPLREQAAAGVPILGICLGMQLLFEGSSEHGGAAGLGLLSGVVGELAAGGERLPHIGWSVVRLERQARLSAGLTDGSAFYHVHSFVCRPADPADVIGTTEHGERFATAVERDNVFGVQFHPEKSSRDGLALLRNFAAVCAPVAA